LVVGGLAAFAVAIPEVCSWPKVQHDKNPITKTERQWFITRNN